MSTSARDAILSGLRASLDGRDRLFRDAAPVERPTPPSPVTSAAGDAGALAEQFGARLEAVAGSYDILEPNAVVPRAIELIGTWTRDANGSGGATVLAWGNEDIPIPDLHGRLAHAGIALVTPDDLGNEDERAGAAAAVVGLTCVEAAFAGTGSIALTPARGRSRAASLLPSHHLVLVPFSRIHPTFESWLEGLRRDGSLPSFVRDSRQLVFVTGPSKSADIELNLTLGVHGPGAVHAVIFDDHT